jgi:hypothetical protein
VLHYVQKAAIGPVCTESTFEGRADSVQPLQVAPKQLITARGYHSHCLMKPQAISGVAAVVTVRSSVVWVSRVFACHARTRPSAYSDHGSVIHCELFATVGAFVLPVELAQQQLELSA